MRARNMRGVARWICGSGLLVLAGCAHLRDETQFQHYMLNYDTAVDSAWQSDLERIDSSLRNQFSMASNETAVGLLDLRTTRLAMVRPDQMDYAASVPKIGILLAYFELHPEAATNLDAETRHKLGLMIKRSSNEIAAEFSQALGLPRIQQVLDRYHFYDREHGGGIWVGKHYGVSTERVGDPLQDHSHAATVRQLLRYYLLLEQDRLVSPAASRTMKEIFASPDIPHDPNKFVAGLAGRNLQIRRKSGTWESWFHDTAVITGEDRHYILVAMTHHPKGDDYLLELARMVDDLLGGKNGAHP